MNTIFPTLSIDRSKIHWEDFLYAYTPVENHAGVFFKREDYFAPLGYNGINGSKLRQLIYVINRGVNHGAQKLISGASVKSPQLSMSTVVASHFGIPTELIIGATKPETAVKHPNVQVSARFGAQFRIIPVAYNPALQREVRAQQVEHPDAMTVEYGITLDHTRNPIADVAAFHELGANQVRNLPDVEELIVPAGSCNTITSVMYGIAKYRPKIKRLFTLAIGPDKLSWVKERLRLIGEYEGIDILGKFAPVNVGQLTLPGTGIEWAHYSLHDTKFSTYQDEMKESFSDIVFHPTYESKMIRWLKLNRRLKQDGSQCFWIVGSAPNISIMEPFYPLPQQEKINVVSK